LTVFEKKKKNERRKKTFVN